MLPDERRKTLLILPARQPLGTEAPNNLCR